jgi:hypothetical protein
LVFESIEIASKNVFLPSPQLSPARREGVNKRFISSPLEGEKVQVRSI